MHRAIPRLAFPALAAAAMSLGVASAARADATDASVKLKAAYVYNFLKYTDWPPSPGVAPEAPFVLTVVGLGDVQAALKDLLDGKALGTRAILVRTLADAASLSGLEPGGAVFLATRDLKEWQALRGLLAARPVLTIADVPGFCAAGGMLNLFEEDNRVRFEANPTEARARGLRLSAELLKLARIVESTAGR